MFKMGFGILWLAQGTVFYQAAKEETWSGEWFAGIILMAFGAMLIANYLEKWRKGE